MRSDIAQRLKVAPGTWSTDEYIRRWARSHGMSSGECTVPLQSLQDRWIARIDFDRKGEPVERVATTAQMEQMEFNG
jgi:hypothetical protein